MQKKENKLPLSCNNNTATTITQQQKTPLRRSAFLQREKGESAIVHMTHICVRLYSEATRQFTMKNLLAKREGPANRSPRLEPSCIYKNTNISIYI